MPKRYIPALIIFMALIGSTIYFYQQESTYIRGMKTAQGVVVKLGSRSTSVVTDNKKTTKTNTQALVDFKVDGSTYRAEGRAMGYPRWKIGQSVDVYYSPDIPQHSRIKRWDELYFYTLLSAFFLLCLILIGAINFIIYRVRGRPFS